MKKTNFFLAGLAAITLTACGSLGSSTTGSTGGSILGDIIGATVNGETIGNAIGSVLGLDKVQENALYGTWATTGRAVPSLLRTRWPRREVKWLPQRCAKS